MKGFLLALLTCSVSMSALALLCMAVSPLLAKRYSEKGRYYAWLILVIGLIIPFRPQFDRAIVSLDLPGETAAPVIRIGNGAPIPIAVPQQPAVRQSAAPAVSPWQVAGGVWLAGVAGVMAYHVIRHCRFVKLAARWSESVSDKQTLTLLHDLQAELGVSRRIGLYRCQSIASPMLLGFADPVILLPETDFAQEALRLVLKHELVHYKRRDLYYKCLVLLATAIHWFNPVVYRMARAIEHQCELSCDAETVRGADEDTRRQYSATILRVARRQARMKTVLSTGFYGGKNGMKKRILSILDTRRKRVGIALLCAALALTLGTAMVFAANTGTARGKADARSVAAGETVIVQILADSVTDLTTYEFELHFDKNALAVKSIHSAIDPIKIFSAVEDGNLTVSGVTVTDDPGDSGGVSGDNLPICEFVMESLRDGPVVGLSLHRLAIWDSARDIAVVPEGWRVQIVPALSIHWDGEETNLYTPQLNEDGLPETLFTEGDIPLQALREPGYSAGEYVGQLDMQVEGETLSPGNAFWGEVSLEEPIESILGTVAFWFDPDELTYLGFEGDEALTPSTHSVDPDEGIVYITFSTLEENDYMLERYGRFQFEVSESMRSSGQVTLVGTANYITVDRDIEYRTGQITIPVQ